MISHYLRLFVRQFSRNKLYQLISVSGLAIGIGAVIVILAWIQFETSYDSFHENADRLIRIYNIQEYPNGNLDVAVTPFPLAPTMAREFPEVESSLRLWYGPGVVVSRADVRTFESGLIYADSTFFEMLSFRLIAGDATTALKRKSSAVISQTIAEKFFRNEDPVGQTLRVNNQSDLTVTGVMAPIPKNSHLAPSMVISMATASDDWPAQRRESWGVNGYSTYLLLHENVNRADFDSRLEKALTTFRGKETTTRLYAQPITEIHLGRVLVADNSDVADPKRLWVFASAAILILIIACINYINLATARSSLRSREFGVRSCLGAGLGQIRRQILAEALTVSAISVLIALVSAELAFPFLRDILSPSLSRDVLHSGFVLMTIPVIWIVTGLAAGAYPAIMLSRRTPARMLRDQKAQGGRLRHTLVVLQFAASLVLILMTMVILRQQQFMRASSLGSAAEQLLVIPLRGEEARQHSATLKEQLQKINGISAITAVAQLPNQIVWSSTYNWEGQNPEDEVLFNTNSVDEEFTETFGLTFVEGRSFRKDETDVCLLNETAVRQIGWESAVGKMMYLDDSLPARIVGVVKDFHFSSLRDEIAPLALSPASDGYSNLVARIVTSDLDGTLKQIEEKANQVLPNTPYRSFFFDQAFDRLYGAEIRMQQTITFFATLAIILACLGLFGLATFSIERRTKEVGIRKVMGASIGNIVGLHIKEYLIGLLVALVVAWPIALWLSRQWLSGFAYRTTVPWWLFAAAGMIVMILALATVSAQTIKAALANPVKSLRYE